MFMVPRTALAGRGSGNHSQNEVLSMSQKTPLLVVLGLDIDGKPHASRFAERNAPSVRRAAELMGFHVIQVSPENAELHALAGGLPLGKIFATGRAFVPFVARGAFDPGGRAACGRLGAGGYGLGSARARRPSDPAAGGLGWPRQLAVGTRSPPPDSHRPARPHRPACVGDRSPDETDPARQRTLRR